jgi:NAD(P)-dependent dehydrogenase (short-subunit alcohol dehydrogenase family)
MDRQPEVVVITGASAGVGRAVAREFGRRRAAVALLARGKDGLAAAAAEIESAGGTALPIVTDVARAAEVEAAAGQAEERLGPIDVWVNDAMATVFAPIWDITPEEFHRATEVTYLGVVYGTQAALKRMLARDRGTIVQVGSALAHRSIPLQSPYCGAKHAIAGFTDSVRCELLHRRSRVRLTVVDLPALNTPQFGWALNRMPNRPQPVPPIYQPEVAARAICWAAHHRRRELTVGWPTFEAMFGEKVAPGLLDRYLGRTGFRSQQTDDPRPPDHRDNLWEPLPGDPGAHGPFDARARRHSLQAWANRHRGALATAACLLGAGGLLAGRSLAR